MPKFHKKLDLDFLGGGFGDCKQKLEAVWNHVFVWVFFVF